MLPKRLQGTVGYARPFALALSRPRFLFAALRLAAEALRSFFYPQFENALFKRRPVVNVDHPLDASIPFEPRYIKKYMEFVQLWMASFYRLWLFYGDGAQEEILGFLAAIRRLYAEAGTVYQRIHTTTTRPAQNYNLRFAVIHALDPHLDCVPSLHVLLVVANWLLASEIVGRLGSGNARGLKRETVELWLRSLRGEALAITESVLFVKQHSVNCIGASLYYLKVRFAGFGDGEAEAFVADLFAAEAGGPGALNPADAQGLRALMLDLCGCMEGSYSLRPGLGWREPILDFIRSFS
jgi:hypothetical protein